MDKKIMIKGLIVVLFLAVIIGSTSCANDKDLFIGGEVKTITPYGWLDQSAKNPDVIYRVNTGNVILSIIFSETIFIPVLLTGTELWEPVAVK